VEALTSIYLYIYMEALMWRNLCGGAQLGIYLTVWGRQQPLALCERERERAWGRQGEPDEANCHSFRAPQAILMVRSHQWERSLM
jgi:hypothetical protein